MSDSDEETFVWLFFVFKYGDHKMWVKLPEPCIYEHFINKARELFPNLSENEFFFTDDDDVKLGSDILPDYVRLNDRGVIVKIHCSQTIVDISNSLPSTSSSNTTYSRVSTPLVDCDDPETTSTESEPKRRRLDNSKNQNSILSKENLLQLIKKSSCGEDILTNYNTTKLLSRKYRTHLVNIVVQYLLQHQQKVNRQLLSVEKCQCAEAIVDLFPNLRNTTSDLGYEHFYNPKTGTGFIANKLSNIRRSRTRSKDKGAQIKKKDSATNPESVVERIDETDIIKDAIAFMKSATRDQKESIIEKTKLTFKFRRFMYLNEHFFEAFPRFLDLPELIDVEFELLFPLTDKNSLIKLYPHYVNAILTVYDNEGKDPSLLEWGRITNAMIALTQLLPPTAKGKHSSSREKARNIIKKLIVFKERGTPLTADEEHQNQPKLIAVGSNKIAIDQYFLEIDKKFILLPTNDIVQATDYLFKAHFVFHVQFDNDLHNFWVLLQHYFYHIPSKVKCTNIIVEIFTKIDFIQKNSSDQCEN